LISLLTYVYIYAYTYTYAYTYLYIYVYIYVYTYVYTYMHTNIYIYMYIYTSMFIYMYIYIYVYMYIHTYIYALSYDTPIRIFISICVYSRLFTSFMHEKIFSHLIFHAWKNFSLFTSLSCMKNLQPLHLSHPSSPKWGYGRILNYVYIYTYIHTILTISFLTIYKYLYIYTYICRSISTTDISGL
jgi:hypothetical protein